MGGPSPPRPATPDPRPAESADRRPGLQGEDGHLREERIAGETLIAGGFLELRRDRVRLPDGDEATREYIAHPGAVAVVPLLDDGRVVVVRQYRYPVAKVLLEFPAGKRDAHESTLACAMRELGEETGYLAREWAYAGAIHNAAAYSTETIWIWFARSLVAGRARPDHGEFIETVLLGAAELEAMDRRGELPDVKTLIALQWLQSWRAGTRELTWRNAADAAHL